MGFNTCRTVHIKSLLKISVAQNAAAIDLLSYISFQVRRKLDMLLLLPVGLFQNT